MSNNIEIVSYFRSGGNFFTQKFIYDTGIRVIYKHTTTSNADIIINIVRNPFDSLVSMVSMYETLNDIKKYDYAEYAKNTYVPYYIDMYNFLFNCPKNIIFIKYEDLNKNNLFSKVYEILNILPIERKNEKFDFDNMASTIKHYQVSSKDNENYQTIRDSLRGLDMSECLKLYQMALDKCIKI